MHYSHTRYLLSAMVSMIIGSGCNQSTTELEPILSLQEISSPADSVSGEPNLVVGDDGKIYLSWIERAGEKRHALQYATHEGDKWTEPRTVVEGERWFVNWADFPSMAVAADGVLAAHWLVRSNNHPYAYNVNLAQSLDGGESWRTPILPHRDGTHTEHGFVSMFPWEDDTFLITWLDGRNFANKDPADPDTVSHSMTLRVATVDRAGHLHEETELDARVCDCCQTSAVRTSYGAIVAYRDRSDGDIRDISIVRWQDGQWSVPQPIFHDGWEIKACPVNGPALAVDGQTVAVAWFTAAHDQSQIKVSFSNDEGMHFGEPIIVDDGDPMGRVDVIMLPEGAALVSWMETAGKQAEFRVRRVRPDGSIDPSMKITSMSQARKSGFPRMIRKENEIFFAWTHSDSTTAVRSMVATLNIGD